MRELLILNIALIIACCSFQRLPEEDLEGDSLEAVQEAPKTEVERCIAEGRFWHSSLGCVSQEHAHCMRKSPPHAIDETTGKCMLVSAIECQKQGLLYSQHGSSAGACVERAVYTCENVRKGSWKADIKQCLSKNDEKCYQLVGSGFGFFLRKPRKDHRGVERVGCVYVDSFADLPLLPNISSEDLASAVGFVSGSYVEYLYMQNEVLSLAPTLDASKRYQKLVTDQVRDNALVKAYSDFSEKVKPSQLGDYLKLNPLPDASIMGMTTMQAFLYISLWRQKVSPEFVAQLVQFGSRFKSAPVLELFFGEDAADVDSSRVLEILSILADNGYRKEITEVEGIDKLVEKANFSQAPLVKHIGFDVSRPLADGRRMVDHYLGTTKKLMIGELDDYCELLDEGLCANPCRWDREINLCELRESDPEKLLKRYSMAACLAGGHKWNAKDYRCTSEAELACEVKGRYWIEGRNKPCVDSKVYNCIADGKVYHDYCQESEDCNEDFIECRRYKCQISGGDWRLRGYCSYQDEDQCAAKGRLWLRRQLVLPYHGRKVSFGSGCLPVSRSEELLKNLSTTFTDSFGKIPAGKADSYELLHKAVKDHKRRVIKALLDDGLDPNLKDQQRGRTPIFYAQDAVTLSLLRRHGAYVDMKDQDQIGPLAYQFTHKDGKPRIFIADGFSLSESELDYLVTHADAAHLEFFLASFGKKLVDAQGRTLLFNHCPKAVHFAVAKKSDIAVDAKAHDGMTALGVDRPLKSADSACGLIPVAERFLASGAKTTDLDSSGRNFAAILLPKAMKLASLDPLILRRGAGLLQKTFADAYDFDASKLDMTELRIVVQKLYSALEEKGTLDDQAKEMFTAVCSAQSRPCHFPCTQTSIMVGTCRLRRTVD